LQRADKEVVDVYSEASHHTSPGLADINNESVVRKSKLALAEMELRFPNMNQMSYTYALGLMFNILHERVMYKCQFGFPFADAFSFLNE
jgi:hypothetical protein